MGAILRDSDYNMEVVWGVVKHMMAPLLSSVRHQYLEEQNALDNDMAETSG